MIRKFHANNHRVRNIMKNGTKWNWPKTSLRTSIADWEPKNSYIHLMQHTEHSQIENYFFKKQYPALFTIHQTKLFRNPDLEKKEFWMLRFIYAKNCGNYKLNSLTAKQVHTFYFDKFSSRLKWTETIFLITSRFKIYFFKRIFITIVTCIRYRLYFDDSVIFINVPKDRFVNDVVRWLHFYSQCIDRKNKQDPSIKYSTNYGIVDYFAKNHVNDRKENQIMKNVS